MQFEQRTFGNGPPAHQLSRQHHIDIMLISNTSIGGPSIEYEFDHK